MAVPSRNDLMVKNLMNQRKTKKYSTKCEKQFPDCPEKPNEKECGVCPFWK